MAETTNYARALGLLLVDEGGYCNRANDRGKETVFGISRVNYPTWPGWATVDMHKAKLGVPNSNPTPQQCSQMTVALRADAAVMGHVATFYKNTYWDVFSGDSLPFPIAYYLLQFSVNTGAGTTGAKLLQKELNFMNVNGKLYPDLAVDGHAGQATINALNRALAQNYGASVLQALLVSEAIQHYKQIMLNDPSQEEFCYGWIRRAYTVAQ